MPEPSPFDPLDRLSPGEDRFTVREKDPCGPGVLTFWAHQRRNRAFKLYGTNPTGDAKRLLDAELVQCAEAEAKALSWSERQQGGEAPDAQRASYADVMMSEEQVAAAKAQKLRTDLQQHLREADFAIHELLAIEGPAASAEMGVHALTIHTLATEMVIPRSEAA